MSIFSFIFLKCELHFLLNLKLFVTIWFRIFQIDSYYFRNDANHIVIKSEQTILLCGGVKKCVEGVVGEAMLKFFVRQ